MSKKKARKKNIRNDKEVNQFGKEGWCLNEKVQCFGNCTECTLRRFPELGTYRTPNDEQN